MSSAVTPSLLFHKCYHHPESKEWVVLIHGAGGSSSIWFKQLKAYRESFNILLLDLRGHGRSNNLVDEILARRYTFKAVTKDIIQLLNHLKIESAHFVGISLGTLIIRTLAELDPRRVKSMVMGGAITRMNIRSQALIRVGNLFKDVLPYMWLYRLFAYIIMPRKNHRESRNLFIREAKKLCQKEFKRWFKLATDINPMMRCFKERESTIPTLYIMGAHDYMFLKPVKEMVSIHRNSQLLEIANCGHVCNVEQPDVFNRESINFIKASY
ncbi:Putative aminoacrylate hydrolase RutD [Vibrio stylophorae]|uniref:Aminoacrylate hydrolase RutD n=1 Tax=Vibrio stylophorae TaxID=659351 RepID=A0ABM8ZY85_9VIBR|nr:alpha/beta hydrolase [Vibrio stylophorae]CAH0535814.1 Putative aminoacrylate hydrolase RutD [Vibrio stylophorae]